MVIFGMFAADTHTQCRSLGSYYPKTVELSSAKSSAYNSKPGPKLCLGTSSVSLGCRLYQSQEMKHDSIDVIDLGQKRKG